MGYGYDATYTNGGGNLLLNSRFGGGGGGGMGGGANLNSQMQAMANMDPSTWMNPLLNYGRNVAAFGLERADWTHNRARNEAEMAARRAGMRLGGGDADPLAAAKTRAQQAQLAAMYQRAPTRMTTFPSGAINAPVMDDTRMTGAQRQLLLPASWGVM